MSNPLLVAIAGAAASALKRLKDALRGTRLPFRPDVSQARAEMSGCGFKEKKIKVERRGRLRLNKHQVMHAHADAACF